MVTSQEYARYFDDDTYIPFKEIDESVVHEIALLGQSFIELGNEARQRQQVIRDKYPAPPQDEATEFTPLFFYPDHFVDNKWGLRKSDLDKALQKHPDYLFFEEDRELYFPDNKKPRGTWAHWLEEGDTKTTVQAKVIDASMDRALSNYIHDHIPRFQVAAHRVYKDNCEQKELAELRENLTDRDMELFSPNGKFENLSVSQPEGHSTWEALVKYRRLDKIKKAVLEAVVVCGGDPEAFISTATAAQVKKLIKIGEIASYFED